MRKRILDYSPKLRAAMVEIEAIITKYDIGAFVILHEPGFGEQMIKLEPSYSAAKIELNGQISFSKGIKSMKDPDALEKMNDTINMINVFISLMGPEVMRLIEVEEYLATYFEINYDQGKMTGRNQIDN